MVGGQLKAALVVASLFSSLPIPTGWGKGNHDGSAHPEWCRGNGDRHRRVC
jgi:hypothetical protein